MNEPQDCEDRGAALGDIPRVVERRETWPHYGGMFAIRRMATLAPLVAGAAYGTQMTERRHLPDRRKNVTGDIPVDYDLPNVDESAK